MQCKTGDSAIENIERMPEEEKLRVTDKFTQQEKEKERGAVRILQECSHYLTRKDEDETD